MEEVHARISPPDILISPERSFEALENDLGLTFPADYKAFLCEYGPGALCGDVQLYHPTIDFEPYCLLTELIQDAFTRNEVESLDFVEMDDGHPAPFRTGTQIGAILPFGDALNWVTVYFIIGDDPEYERSGLPFGKWLLRYLDGGGSRSHFVTAKASSKPPYFTPASAYARPRR